ncbi:hypothetical protein CHS0354_040075 [Potamilus streckersoni]|uniref:SAM domain-containing protein n=1 Tax=Potamilus streckersoni TaxID=2493646 RepID=A0AAE0STC3_9BIVA|nr:hypothetical protein CHS0354_040075 [Potamilus streckersoni]
MSFSNTLILILSVSFVITVSQNQAPITSDTPKVDLSKTEHLSASGKHSGVKNGDTEPHLDCKTKEECEEESLSMEAIKELHRIIDDDNNGNVDQSESGDFIENELKNTKDGYEKMSIFHGNDKLISVGDLWQAWKKSPVCNWTVEDVIDWLQNSVELPQYSPIFKKMEINGSRLPRLAVNNHTFMSIVLGIKNAVHKQKLSLKAMDAVLFGSPKRIHSVVKDVVLLVSLVVAALGCWFAYMQNKRSRREVNKMMKELDSLQKAEESLLELQTKLDNAEKQKQSATQEKINLEQKFRSEVEIAKMEAEELKKAREDKGMEENTRLKYAERELEQVRAALRRAEKELELKGGWSCPAELQAWLQYTFEIEQQHFHTKQQAAQRQFLAAKEACEKMRKKRTGMLGTLRIAQGNSMDEIDQRIMQARSSLEEVRHDLQERQQRWLTIEALCGFPIKTNPGVSCLEHMLYGDSANSGNSARLPLMTLDVDEADEDLPPPITKGFSGTGQIRQRRTQNIPNATSLSKIPQLVASSSNSKMALSNSEGVNGSARPVSFHLGESSPSSPESPNENLSSSQATRVVSNEFSPSLGLKNKSQSMAVITSKIPSPNGSNKPLNQSAIEISHSEENIHRKTSLTSLQSSAPAGEEECVSGTDSFDGDVGKKKKKKLKFLPKFMRKLDSSDKLKTSTG